jgi:predicted DNA-binding protein with PD1-like motif
VTGLLDRTDKVVPHYEEFDDARESVGVDAQFQHERRPALHFHAGMGRAGSTLVGYPRAGISVYLVLEVIITELVGLGARSAHDHVSGVNLLKLGGVESRRPERRRGM